MMGGQTLVMDMDCAGAGMGGEVVSVGRKHKVLISGGLVFHPPVCNLFLVSSESIPSIFQTSAILLISIVRYVCVMALANLSKHS